MGSRVRIRLFHLHFVMDFLLPLLKNSKSVVDDRGHRFRSGSPLTNYPHASAAPPPPPAISKTASLMNLKFCRVLETSFNVLEMLKLFT